MTGGHALYQGTVRHRRFEPPYSFSKQLLMPMLDLDDLDSAYGVHPLFSDRRFSPLRFRRSDHYGDQPELAEAIRALVTDQTGVRPEGRVVLLANLRVLGWSFNPVAVYWCGDANGATAAQVLEVTNTPWGESHCYVLDTRGIQARTWTVEVDKELHVSPFLPMELRHRVTSATPADELVLAIDDLDLDGRTVFEADLRMTRCELDRQGVSRLLLEQFPGTSRRVSASIYRHAAGLARAGARFRRHPRSRK